MSAETSIVSVYDGTRLLGHIRECDRQHVARTWPQEVLLGSYKTRKEAADAISVARRMQQTGGKR